MREKMGIDEKGRIVYYLHENPNPDLFSYDDEIRQKYLDNPKEVEADKDYRPWEDSYARLGYSVPRDIHRYLVHSFEEKFGENFSSVNETENRMLLRLAPSVVSLCSFIDDKRLFTCSGIVIESTDGSATILTSACLVAIPNGETARTVAENVKICVHFIDGPTYDACLLGCCLHYNVAFVRIQKEHQDVLPLPGKGIESMPDVVFALGRHYVSREIMGVTGEPLIRSSNFDCVELMFSSCKITKCGIGGPLVNSHGGLVGVNFYNKDDTPYLPSSLVLRCWEHIKTYRSVAHLDFGWRIRPLRQMNANLLENIYERYKVAFYGLLVEEVARSSPAYGCGIKDGDIVLEFFGEPAITVPESKVGFKFNIELWLSCNFGLQFYWISQNFCRRKKVYKCRSVEKFMVKILRQSNQSQLDHKYLTIDATRLNSSHFNRWPLPQAEWIADYTK